jgi:LacI family transcriptional regulator
MDYDIQKGSGHLIKSTGTVTIKSIAEALGISFSTVSKALNNDPAISQQTRDLVQAKAKEMNYTRNYFAQSLRQKGSKTVAIIVNDIEIPAYGEMIAIISGKLAAHGYTTMVSDSQYSEEFERSAIRTVLSRMPEAVIITPADPTGKNIQLLEPMYDRTLVLGDLQGSANTSSLYVDHRLAGRLSAEHLLSNGVEQNLILGGPEGYQSSDLFLHRTEQGFQGIVQI